MLSRVEPEKSFITLGPVLSVHFQIVTREETMAAGDIDAFKDIPGYKVIFKSVLKNLIQNLVGSRGSSPFPLKQIEISTSSSIISSKLFKDIPGYKVIFKSVLKNLIQNLVGSWGFSRLSLRAN